jgi:hypothetical protein
VVLLEVIFDSVPQCSTFHFFVSVVSGFVLVSMYVFRVKVKVRVKVTLEQATKVQGE